MILSNAGKAVMLTALGVALENGKLRFRDSFGATLCDVTTTYTLTGTDLDLDVPALGVNILSGVAVDALVLKSDDTQIGGPVPVYLSGGAAHLDAIANGEDFVALSTTTLVSGAQTQIDDLVLNFL